MHLLCLDFSNLLIRHASIQHDQYVDAEGRPIGGAVGSLRQVIRLFGELSPSHLLIAKDGPRSQGFRRQIDPAYKANRGAMDKDLDHDFAIAYRGLSALGMPVVSRESYEADDVIASASQAFPERSTVVSGDKDLLALCSKQVVVRLLRPGGHIDCGPDECEEIMGVTPALVRDYKALCGDSSDGITGVIGIGHKRAIALLDAYGSAEEVLKAARSDLDMAGVSRAVSEKVKHGVEDAERSYELAGLVRDVPVPGLIDLEYSGLPTDSVAGKALGEMGLGALRRLLPGYADANGERDSDDFASLFERALSQA